ncbi:MAG: tryptophan halogenase family protein [Litorimonas sp.]
MNTPNQVKRIVIVGGGSAGWMSAAALSNALGNSADITLVESEAIGTVGVGEATIPPIRQFNDRLGISEAEFIRATKGSFKLGIEFAGWTKEGETYFHPFGHYGADFDVHVPFHHYWLSDYVKGGQAGPLDDYSICYTASKAGRFAHPNRDPRQVQSRLDYAYHFDATLYAGYLRTYAETRGVNRIQGRVSEVLLDPQNGHIESVKLDGGKTINGDLFLDCTGFMGVLIEGAMKTGYEDWSNWLPCNRAVAIPSEGTGGPLPYTRSTCREAGWQWRIPLQHRTGNGYVYCDRYSTPEKAEQILRNNLDGPPIGSAKHLRFMTGRRKKFWNKNCVAVGLSAGFMEPLESTSLHLIQFAIMRLLTLFPDTEMSPLLAEEYNRLTTAEYERIRDFLVLHYIANEREEPFWKEMAALDISDALQFKIDHFRENGVISLDGRELFGKPSWLAVLIGQGVFPKRAPGLSGRAEARGVPVDIRFAQVKDAITAATDVMPSHPQAIQNLIGKR